MTRYKNPVTTKKTMETACRKAGLKPIMRGNYRNEEIFIADGFASKPGITFQKFGGGGEKEPYKVDEKEYLMGTYCTFWFLADENDVVTMGHPVFFDPFHDTNLDISSKQQARVNKTMKIAEEHIELRNDIRAKHSASH